MTVQLREVLGFCDRLLKPWQFQDYCPNGLQVEGEMSVEKLVTGVTASRALIEAAIDKGAQAILVHHGYFWKGDDPRIQGMLRHRLALLLRHNISLIAYHLPLDAQPEFGNNVSLAQLLGIEITGALEPEKEVSIGLLGRVANTQSAQQFSQHLERCLGRAPLHVAGTKAIIETVAWCTGAAQGLMEKASRLGIDAYITGEISEQTTHIARETGVHFFAAGHHATERYGVQGLGQRIAKQFEIQHRFIDIENPA